jgi:hypothetical protein
MKKEKKYRVFVDNSHDYNIDISENEDADDVYKLIRTGNSWSKSIRGEVVCQMINDGNGYHIKGVNMFMDYAEVMDLQILLQFVSWYESKNASVSSIVTIEACKEKISFTI